MIRFETGPGQRGQQEPPERENDVADEGRTPWIARHAPDLALVLFAQPEGGEQVLLLVDMVGFEDRAKDGEAILRVERGVKVVLVDGSDFLR
jgi:hypothetical protein